MHHFSLRQLERGATRARMDRLSDCVERGDWPGAYAVAKELAVDRDYVPKHQFLQSTLTPQLLTALLPTITDALWTAQAAFDVLRTAESVQLAKLALPLAITALDAATDESPLLLDLIHQQDTAHAREKFQELMREDDRVRSICVIRKAVLQYQDRLNTWESIWGHTVVAPASHDDPTDEEATGWDELDIPSSPPQVPDPSHPTLRQFLDRDLLPLALSFAASAQLSSLTAICFRHSTTLWPHRQRIIDAIPEWSDPAEYVALLSKVDSAGREERWEGRPHRAEDWIEGLWPTIPFTTPPVSPEALSSYYANRITKIANLGLVAESLSLVQHCASHGIPGLDALGEELSLLHKLAHDRPGSAETDEEFTLARWREMSNEEVVYAYLAYSTPATVTRDIRRLVMPFLYLRESRMEKLGTPDPTLATKELYNYVLHLASSPPPRAPAAGKNKALGLLVAIFEGSKPTLAKSTRIIKNDEDLARLALASLYGCKDIASDAFVAMGAIFECLPAFEGADPAAEGAPPTTLFDLFPSSSSPTAHSLFAALQSFPASSLSAALDALDLHLATAETFSRYSLPIPLAWFLTSHADSKSQRAWATRMARTASSGGGARGEEGEGFESEDEWVALMEDMVGLCDEGDEGIMKKAFWLLDREEVLRIFFAGLLASGSTFITPSTVGTKLTNEDRIRIGEIPLSSRFG